MGEIFAGCNRLQWKLAFAALPDGDAGSEPSLEEILQSGDRIPSETK
jgi:hypothetical protein